MKILVSCTSGEDVAEAIARARRDRLARAVRSGGHCFAGRSSVDGIVIDVSPMRSVSVSGDVVTVGAGARLGEIYESLAEHGLTIPAGSCPTVGIAGLTLGGGFGFLGRSRGLTCDSLLAARVVLADGRTVDCDEQRDADLFWALRGAGGGQFGVVTSLTFRAGPTPPDTTFRLAWRPADAVKVIEAWQDWAPDGPDELAASLLLTEEGPVVFGSAAADLLDAFVAMAGVEPLSAAPFHEELAFRDTFSKSGFFRRRVPAEALVEHFYGERVPGQRRELDFTPWGGAYNRVPVRATAFAHRDARFLLKHSVTAVGDAREWLRRSHALAAPWGTGGVYPNFPDPSLTDWARAYHGVNYARLRRVKARYDPDGFFRFHQAIPPAEKVSTEIIR
ncbi:FAD-binding oxidoreductase [Actinoplanes sp. CA-142083]|uniref:FAD-binding oxidoreductase n=1 Tax=Actinoplanes sp. CA-142083 TaxID=3239903 RepID=UPI003D8D3A32